jgi:hypothetical protein
MRMNAMAPMPRRTMIAMITNVPDESPCADSVGVTVMLAVGSAVTGVVPVATGVPSAVATDETGEDTRIR